MTLYAIYRSESALLPEAVAEKFSWFAALLPPLHALCHRLWDQLALFVVALVALVVVARLAGGEAAWLCYLVTALAFGFAAPGARGRAWRRRHYGPAGHRVAADADLARLAALEAR